MQTTKGFLAILICVFICSCASVKLRTADTYYEQLQYANAIPYYEEVMRKKYSDEVMIKLADCYRNIKNYHRSEQLYSRIINIKSDVEYLYNYADALMQNGKYSDAKKYFEKYLQINRTDERAMKQLLSCDSIGALFKDSLLYSVVHLKINKTLVSNYSPTHYKSGIVFISNRNPDEKAAQSKSTIEDYNLFYAKKTENGNWLEPELLRGSINSIFNEGPCVFNKNFTTVYITRNDNEGKKIVTNEKDVNVLKIYKGSFSGGEWNIEGEMPFNNSAYSVGHPALNESGNVMYFVSDMPWGYGGTDIYRTENMGGTWTQPVNLGKNINTPGNEMFPFLANDSVLYFSSNGKIGIGGLDIFRSEKNNSEWSIAENLGYPINSSKDDFGLICDSQEESGYFSSNRIGDADKIFSFIRNLPAITLHGVLTEKATGKALKNARVILSGSGNDIELFTDESGIFFSKLKNNTDYKISVSEKGFFHTALDFSVKGIRKPTEIIENISLEKVTLNKPVLWYKIAFAKGDYAIKPETADELNKLFAILNENPNIKIELTCHTDSRGNDKDNLILSQHRADAAAEYLYQKGIERDRILAVGYGESKLLNNCINGVLCLEEDHQINIRTEIKYLNYSK